MSLIKTITGTTNSVKVVYSTSATLGTLTVTATNAAGCTSIARSLAITGLKVAIIPADIQGGLQVDPPVIPDVTTIKNELNVYPNPTSGSVTFEFRINQDAKVKLDIYSVNGQLIDRIFEGDAMAGISQTVKFDQSLPTGIYPCVMRWNGKKIIVKLIINQ